MRCPTLQSCWVSHFEKREKPENLAQRQLFVIRSPLTSADSSQGWINLRFLSLSIIIFLGFTNIFRELREHPRASESLWAYEPLSLWCPRRGYQKAQKAWKDLKEALQGYTEQDRPGDTGHCSLSVRCSALISVWKKGWSGAGNSQQYPSNNLGLNNCGSIARILLIKVSLNMKLSVLHCCLSCCFPGHLHYS